MIRRDKTEMAESQGGTRQKWQNHKTRQDRNGRITRRDKTEMAESQDGTRQKWQNHKAGQEEEEDKTRQYDKTGLERTGNTGGPQTTLWVTEQKRVKRQGKNYRDH